MKLSTGYKQIVLIPAINDHPIVAQILQKRIRELSTKPEHETVFLIAHGPIDEYNNRRWILNGMGKHFCPTRYFLII